MGLSVQFTFSLVCVDISVQMVPRWLEQKGEREGGMNVQGFTEPQDSRLEGYNTHWGLAIEGADTLCPLEAGTTGEWHMGLVGSIRIFSWAAHFHFLTVLAPIHVTGPLTEAWSRALAARIWMNKGHHIPPIGFWWTILSGTQCHYLPSYV